MRLVREDQVSIQPILALTFFVRECSESLLSDRVRLKRSVEMHTVNGNVTVDEGLRIAVPTLEKEMEFILLPNSPPIISIGRRCMVDGYEFHWP